MKILLSPSKTKKLQGKPTAPVFDKVMTDAIVGHMKTLTAEVIVKALKVKPDMAAELVAFYQNHDDAPVGRRLSAIRVSLLKIWHGLNYLKKLRLLGMTMYVFCPVCTVS